MKLNEAHHTQPFWSDSFFLNVLSLVRWGLTMLKSWAPAVLLPQTIALQANATMGDSDWNHIKGKTTKLYKDPWGYQEVILLYFSSAFLTFHFIHK